MTTLSPWPRADSRFRGCLKSSDSEIAISINPGIPDKRRLACEADILYTLDAHSADGLRRGTAGDYAGVDGTISAVSATSPDFPTPRGLRCGDMPRRAWELYGYEFAHMLRCECPDNGPITAIGFTCLKEETVHMDTPYIPFVPGEWFDTPAFWES